MHIRSFTALVLALTCSGGCGKDDETRGDGGASLDAAMSGDAGGNQDAAVGGDAGGGEDAAVENDAGNDAGGDAAVVGGEKGYLLVATSHVPRLIDLATGSTTEVFEDRLRWQQNPGHLYQHWDVSPDGASVVVYHESGSNAPAGEDLLVVYSLDDSTTGKVLLKTGGTLGAFTGTPCFADDHTVYFLPSGGGVWKVDPTLDDTQTPEKVEDIPNQDQLNGPKYWNRDCTAFIARGYRSNNTNDGSDNLAHYVLGSNTLTQLSQHYGNNKGMTLAQDTNRSSCSGTGCVTARNGGTTEKMGFLPSGNVWFDSNRDVWRDGSNAFHGEPLILEVDPSSGDAFADLTALDGPRVRAVSRDGKLRAVSNGDSIEVLDENGTRVVLSSPDFNAANVPGFMRFVD